MKALEISFPLLSLLLQTTVCSSSRFDNTLFYEPEPDHDCSLSLVESIPENLTFANSTIEHMSTYAAYQFLVGAAIKELNFASFYWSLQGYDVMQKPGNLAFKGEQLFAAVLHRSQQVPVLIANNIGGFNFNESDLVQLAKQPNIGVVRVNIHKLLGGGVQHAKLVLADGRHAYLGSSNMDWRSLTQVKELGLLFEGCPTLVGELKKVFQTYWLVGKRNLIPDRWPDELAAAFNASRPWIASVGNFKYSIYLGVSPAELTPSGWSRDIDAIVSAILSARKFVHIAVMDYEAAIQHAPHERRFWGVIDSALRTAAMNGTRVRLLVSHWNQSSYYVGLFLRALTALNSSKISIEGKYFIVPYFTDEQRTIPFARVNHNKYMVTEDTAVICTSNWEGSYFRNTAGVATSITQISTTSSNSRHRQGPKEFDNSRQSSESIVEQVQDVFERDWNSKYAHWNFPERG